MESWVSGGSSEFVQVSLHQDFIKSALCDLRKSVNQWLEEPIQFCNGIGKICHNGCGLSSFRNAL